MVRVIAQLGGAETGELPRRQRAPGHLGADDRARELERFAQLADESATTQEQANRKRRLLKGPEEFQNVRIDRSSTKK